jgi:hypothetical protein
LKIELTVLPLIDKMVSLLMEIMNLHNSDKKAERSVAIELNSKAGVCLKKIFVK